MRVAVSGSSGLIGTALVQALRARGDEVLRLVRRPVGAPDELTWDPRAGQAPVEALAEVDGLVHLAGAGIGDQRWTPQRKQEIRDSRVQGTSTLATALAAVGSSGRAKPPVFVSGSAIGYYGDRGEEELDETSPPGTGFLAEVCQAWEAATAPAAEAGARVALLRTGVVLSARGGALARQLPLFRLGLGGTLGDGRQWLSWITLRDEVHAILACLDRPELEGPVNLTAPTPVRNAEFTQALGRVLKRPARFGVPRGALRLALGGQLTDEALLASQRVLPRRLVEAGFAFQDPTLEAALATALAD
jgi:uncharacterized protein (TIGR01777 family)